MRFVALVSVVLITGCDPAPPCGDLVERPVPEVANWCLDDYQPERLCCDGVGCVMLVDYDDGGGFDTAAVPLENGRECGTEAECLSYFDEVEAWCAWNADNQIGETPPAPEL